VYVTVCKSLDLACKAKVSSRQVDRRQANAQVMLSRYSVTDK